VLGLIEYSGGGRMRLTHEGRRLAHQPDVALTAEDLHARVLQPAARARAARAEADPRGLTGDDLGESKPQGLAAGAELLPSSQFACVTDRSPEFPTP
jgi:hypothetical protein